MFALIQIKLDDYESIILQSKSKGVFESFGDAQNHLMKIREEEAKMIRDRNDCVYKYMCMLTHEMILGLAKSVYTHYTINPFNNTLKTDVRNWLLNGHIKQADCIVPPMPEYFHYEIVDLGVENS